MPDWVHNTKKFRMPLAERAHELSQSLGPGGRALFLLLSALIIASAGGLLLILNDSLMVPAPARGGAFSEGVVGSPRFINPLLAITDADNDVTSLVYSGLLKATPQGDFLPDMAAHFEVSGDGRIYTVSIRQSAVFQDGTPVTADDVIYTVGKAQDPALKSPQRANWDGVTAEKTDEHTVRFTLRTAYAPFVENLTLGILPKHLWQDVSNEEFPFSELNTMPIGSGPFTVKRVDRSASGIPTAYMLSSFNRYALGEPYLGSITLHFYQNEDDLISALKSGAVEAGSGVSPEALSRLKGFNVISAPLDRVFGVFFNQNQAAVLRDTAVRKALNDSVDRADLVASVLSGYGAPVSGPIPPTISGETVTLGASSTAAYALALAARTKLMAAGWKEGPDGFLEKKSGSGKNASTATLAFTLATGNVPELRAAAEYLKKQWAKVGANVTVQIFDQGDLSENVIRPRKYDALLFGEVVGRGLDLFAFWDSSQRNDPGLNIALYANPAADAILAKLRTASSDRVRQDLYAQFAAQLSKDVPAVFLYAPDFVYVFPKNIEGLQLGFVSVPSDRFLSAPGWYRHIDRVWPFFAPGASQNSQ